MTSLLIPDLTAAGECCGLDELETVIDQLQARGVPASQVAGEYDVLLTRYQRAIRRLESIKLAVVAAADQARVAEHTGLADTSSWLARRTHTDAAAAARETRLATALEANPSRACAEALAEGVLS